VALWLVCIQVAMHRGEDAVWIRISSALGAFVVVHMWLVKEACVDEPEFWRRTRGRLARWLVPASILAGLSFTPWYLVPGAEPGDPWFGPMYFAYVVCVIGLFIALFRETLAQIRTQTGLSRLELQIVLLGGTVTAFAVMLLMGLRAALGFTWLIELQPLLVFVFYSATAVAITTHRVLDARQILCVVFQGSVLVLSVSLLAFALGGFFRFVAVPPPVALIATIGAVLWAGHALKGWLDRVFEFYPQTPAVRHAAFAVARRTDKEENLRAAFENIVNGWGHSERAVIVHGSRESMKGNGIELTADSPVLRAIRESRWATPERLARERSTPERHELERFLAGHGLAALVISEGATVDTLVGVGPTASRRPFTYPQITQLTELASIIGSALERAHFSTKAQHAEQLATVGLLGASMAHEIRNPLVTIKTFVQLLPTHYQDPAFREKFFRLIAEEVDRIDRLTEQLLDLASPRTYSPSVLELHPVLRTTIDLIAPKAAKKDVQLVTDFEATPDVVHTDPAAARQVMLNLCFNAIQALETKTEGQRCIWVATRNTQKGIEVAVSDTGAGIAPEMLPRLFKPFQTTKSSGFGLGLAICSDILTNLNATIAVDPPVPGKGATFRVTFPCHQPSSS
jgi:signal transduction histidine kinase